MFFGVAQALANVVYPSFCPGCRSFISSQEVLCAECLAALPPLVVRDFVLASGRVLSVYAVTRYDGVVQRLVRAKNYNQRTAAWQLGELVARYAPCPWDIFDSIVSVPLHWSRAWWRGFNQSQVMAQSIGCFHSKDVFAPLIRIRRTAFQAELRGVSKRIENLVGAFDFSSVSMRNRCKGKSILIVDDVLTTGSTITSLARLLYQAGAAHVGGVVAGR